MTKRALALLATLALAAGTARAARFELRTNDPEDAGFNDPTPVDPVTGNAATTLGEQRENVLMAVAREWGWRLAGDPLIVVNANWVPLECTSTSGTLAAAGPTLVFRSFEGAPKEETHYTVATANAIAGHDLRDDLESPPPDLPEHDISVLINRDVGVGGCLPTVSWGYEIGVLTSDSEVLSLYDSLLHEFAHGLGFLSIVDPDTGEQLGGLPDAFSRNLEDHGLNRRWPKLDDEERRDSITDTGNLHWIGRNVHLWGNTLFDGRHEGSRPHVRMYAPESFVEGSSVSHFDTSLEANADELMEPFSTRISDDLLTLPLLQDVGWAVNRPKIRELEDVDGQGRQDLAVLTMGFDPAGQLVRVFDPATAVLINDIVIPPTVSAIDLQVVPSFGGSSASELAVLVSAARGPQTQVLVFDALTGEELSSIDFSIDYPKNLTVIPSFAASPADELAVLGIGESFAPIVVIKDSATADRVLRKKHRKWQPSDLEWIPSFAGSPAPEIVVSFWDSEARRGGIYVSDAGSGESLAVWELEEEFLPQFSAVVSDYDDSPSPEIALAGLREGGKPTVKVLDPVTGKLLLDRRFNDRQNLLGLERISHFRNRKSDELVLVGKRALNKRTKLLVFDSRSGVVVGSGGQGQPQDARAMEVVSSLGGKSGRDDIVLLSVAAADGLLRLGHKDGSGEDLGSLVIGGE